MWPQSIIDTNTKKKKFFKNPANIKKKFKANVQKTPFPSDKQDTM